MNFQRVVKRALEVRKKYAEWEKVKYGREWTREQIAQGLVVDVGDLVRLVMAKEGVREIGEVDQKLAHELSDCLWSILVIADKYNIDIEKSFFKTMDEIETLLKR